MRWLCAWFPQLERLLNKNDDTKMDWMPIVYVAAGVLAVVGVVIVLLNKRKKKNSETDSDETNGD